MNAEKSRSGQCLCGKVKLRLVGDVQDAGVCHCDMCRRWSGGPGFALDGEYEVVIDSGEDDIVYYRSSEWAERGFCGTCGSNLFYKLVESGRLMAHAGTLDDQSGPEVQKPDFHR